MKNPKYLKKTTIQAISPHNILRIDGAMHGCSEFWEILGVYLGPTGTESLVQVRSLTKTPNYECPRPYIPVGMLAAAIEKATIRVFAPIEETTFRGG
ncbi:MAG: hypothetical protein ABSG22_10765 [Sedimentisphaerales bacterium]